MDQWTALMISLGVEVPVVIMFAWALRWAPADDLGWLALLALSGTCLTQPVGWWLVENLAPTLPLVLLLALVWSVVATAEGLAFSFVLHLPRARALALSAITNAAGFAALLGCARVLDWSP